jgi:hypothetical protein
MMKKGKLCLLKVSIFTYHYGPEMWTWTKADGKRLVAADLRCLRIIE